MKRCVSLLCAALLLLGASAPVLAQDDAPAKRGAAGFKAADANGDGKITKDEYLDHARKLAEKRWEKLDTEKKGYITLEDAQAAKRKRAEAHQARKAKAAQTPAQAPAAPPAQAPAAQ